ncbi:MAG: contractile injection system tape measure protein [Cytophagales bacterium]|nr:contractile injection system tape measure protein [Cytophagales bacterium]
MSNPKHIIRQQVLELSIVNDQGARDIQEEVSDVFKSRVIPRMEQLFDKLSEEGQVLKIDRLEINLGDIDQVYLKEELPLHVERLLEEEITKLLYHRQEGIPGQVQAVTVGWSDAKLAAFQYLLRTGVHAWNSTFKAQSLTQLFVELSKHSSSQTREIMMRELSHDYVRKRVGYQFNMADFESLIFLLSTAHGEVAIALVQGLLLLRKRISVLSTFPKAWEQQVRETLLQVIIYQGKEPATSLALVQQVVANLLTSWEGHLRRYTRTIESNLSSVLIQQIHQALLEPEIKSTFKQAHDPLLKFLEQQDATVSKGYKTRLVKDVETKSSLKSTYKSDLQVVMGGDVTQKRGGFIDGDHKESTASKSVVEAVHERSTSLRFENDQTVPVEEKPVRHDPAKAVNEEKETDQRIGRTNDFFNQTEKLESHVELTTDHHVIDTADSDEEISGDELSHVATSHTEMENRSQDVVARSDDERLEKVHRIDDDTQIETDKGSKGQIRKGTKEVLTGGVQSADHGIDKTKSYTQSESEQSRSTLTESTSTHSHSSAIDKIRANRDHHAEVQKQGPTASEQNNVEDEPETTQEKSHEKAPFIQVQSSVDTKDNTIPDTSAREQQSQADGSSKNEGVIMPNDKRSDQEVSDGLETSPSQMSGTPQTKSNQQKSTPEEIESQKPLGRPEDQSTSETVTQKITDTRYANSSHDQKPVDKEAAEIDDLAKVSSSSNHDPSEEHKHRSQRDQIDPSDDVDSNLNESVRPMNRIVPHPEDRFVAPLWRKPPEIIEEAQIGNAGLALLWPYLPILFKGVNWVKDGAFVSEEYQFRAIHFLQYMATGAVATEEQELAFNKLLVGMQPEVPVPFDVALTDEELEEAQHLLQTVLESWKALKSNSVDLLRQTFLQKEGLLKKDMASWKLFVERSAFDILLDRLPWSYSVVKLPWMDNLINVEW